MHDTEHHSYAFRSVLDHYQGAPKRLGVELYIVRIVGVFYIINL